MTGTAADLRDLETSTCAYALRFEGIATTFVTDENLADGTWLTEHATVLPCLDLPTYSMGINFRKSKFRATTTTFTLNDVDNSLVDLFASVRDDVEELESTLAAGDVAALNAPQELWSKHVGIEYIGSAGQRMQYPAIPGWDQGYEHVGRFNAASAEQAAVPVSAKPLVWSGRRAALIRVFHNSPTAGSNLAGVNWTSPANSDVIWFGTVLDSGQVRGKTWQVQCAGPESWLQKLIGNGTWTTPIKITADIDLSDDEAWVGAWSGHFFHNENGYSINAEYGEDALTTQAASSTIADIEDAFGTAILNAATTLSGADGEYTNAGAGEVNFGEHTDHVVGIRIDAQAANSTVGGIMVVVAHRKAWSALGFLLQSDPNGDPTVPLWGQNLLPPDHEFRVDAYELKDNQVSGISAFPVAGAKNTKTSGYWALHFRTVELEESLNINGDRTKNDNDGSMIHWKPIYGPNAGGVFTLYANPSAPQAIELDTQSPVYITGQNDAAPLSDTDDPTAGFNHGAVVDSTRLFLFFGPREMAAAGTGGSNIVTETQVARCSWSDISGTISLGATGRPRLVIHEWLDPKLFGFNRKPLQGDWSGLANPIDVDDAIYCVPLNHIGGGSADGAGDTNVDAVHHRIQSLLLGSGTSTGHSSFSGDQANVLDVGDNEPDNNGEPNPVATKDYEIAENGLAIPASRVQGPGEFWKEWIKLEGGLRYTKQVYGPPVSGTEILASMLEPLGWCWHLRDGKFGVFCPWDVISPDDAAITITSEDYSSANGRPTSSIPRQKLRVLAPIDRVELKWNFDLLDGEHTETSSFRANDRGARYRVNNVVHPIKGGGFRFGEDWETDFRTRWSRGFEWWGRRHFKVAGQKLQRKNGQRCWPGTLIRYTDQWVVNPDGTYSVSNFGGFVERMSYDCAKEEANVDLLIQEDGGQGIRFYSPAARMFAWDTSSSTAYCHDDFREVGSGHIDTRWFAEPWWSEVGGSMDVEALQWDGDAWSGGIYNTVSSADATEGAASIVMSGAWTGATLYRDRDTIIIPREFANQGAAWVKALFAAVANEAGEVNGSAANAVKFNGA